MNADTGFQTTVKDRSGGVKRESLAGKLPTGSSQGDSRPIIALLYDFDKTLSTRDMQEYTFLPQLGLNAASFWDEADHFSSEDHMDPVLAYMYLMIRKMRSSSDEHIFTREEIHKLGHGIEFFPGVETWFERVNRFGADQAVRIEHYIISSGLREIIEGSRISGAFRAIFASEFHYDRYGAPDWPLLAVNYTGKTQFLFRINKGVLDVSDNTSLNEFTPDDRRRVPFRNMIYLGDGMTDVPCMKLVRSNSGASIAVYSPENYEKVKPLLSQKRVNFLMKADYRDGSPLDRLVRALIGRMALTSRLLDLEHEQIARLGDSD